MVETAAGVGVAGDLAVPAGLLVAIGPAALLGALLASAVPAARACRRRPRPCSRADMDALPERPPDTGQR